MFLPMFVSQAKDLFAITEDRALHRITEGGEIHSLAQPHVKGSMGQEGEMGMMQAMVTTVVGSKAYASFATGQPGHTFTATVPKSAGSHITISLLSSLRLSGGNRLQHLRRASRWSTSFSACGQTE